MAYQFKTSNAKIQSPNFVLDVKDFEILNLLCEYLNISRAEFVALALKNYFGEKNEISKIFKKRKNKKKI